MVRYHSPLAQVLIISGVCFLCPGMFNALNGLGGAGQLDTHTTNNANTALYTTFGVFSIAGGGIVNVFGVRYTASVSCLTYAVYTGSYIYYNNTGNGILTIISGAILGVGAGVLWTAQGTIMVSYPTEKEKGKFISIFWVIFNLGGLIGGILPFAINFYRSGSLTDSVYALFVVLECAGSIAALFLIPPICVVRDDGSHATIVKSPSARQESLEILKLFKNKWMLLLLPMSFTSNFFYGYQFSQYNGAIFTLRTRGFNNLLYWASQILGSYVLSFLLDFPGWPRRKRGIYATAIMAVAFNAVWACTLAVQLRYTKGADATDYPGGLIDFLQTERAGAPITLYFFMGLVDSWYQTLAYWVIGTLTNDSRITARYVGFYKGVQSLGAAVSWQIGAREVPFLNQVIGNWALLLISLPTIIYTVAHIEDRALDEQLICTLHKDEGASMNTGNTHTPGHIPLTKHTVL
ncbi:MFS general substrate transporter [Martensiomyces pterosporus]|nr:MFS general substrate transporter [Martensiomyces pterosporus]